MSLDLLTALIGTDVIRTSPNGDVTTFTITRREEAEYLHWFQSKGFTLKTI